MYVEEKELQEIKVLEEKAIQLRNEMIEESNNPEYAEKKIKEIQE